MSGKKKNRKRSDSGKRLSFPEDEKERSWLALLLEGYHIIDRGVSRAIESGKQKGRKLACGRGCFHCCSTHKDIPVYPLEIAGISWYAAYKIKGPARDLLKRQLEEFRPDNACPFLLEGVCSIHPLRPMACRQFNVFEQQCREGEDPYYTRREDVMDPVKKYVDQAFFIMLPFYGVEKESDRTRMIETGAFHRMVKELHSCSWHELARKMERHERSNDKCQSSNAKSNHND